MAIKHGIGPLVSRALLASPIFIPAQWISAATHVTVQIRVMLHHSVARMDSIFAVPSTPEFSQCTHVGQIDRGDLLIVNGKDFRIGDVVSFNGEMERRSLDPINDGDPCGF